MPGVPEYVHEVWREHRRVIGVAALYIAAGGIGLTAFGRPWHFRLMYPLVAMGWASASAAYLFWQWGHHPDRLRAALSPTRVLGAVLVPFILVPFQVTFQSLKLAIGYSVGFPWDPFLIRVDEAMHNGPAWHLLGKAYDFPALLEFGFYTYQSGWVIVGFLVLVWAAWHPDRQFRERLLLSNLLLWIVAGTVFAYLFASAGPCYVDVADFQAVTRQLENAGLVLVEWQRDHWYGQVNQIWHPFAGVSAFPSLHIAISTLIALAIGTRSKIGGWVFGAFAVWIEIWSVILNWHYAIDGYGGALLAVFCWVWAGRLTTVNIGSTGSEPAPVGLPRRSEMPSHACVQSDAVSRE